MEKNQRILIIHACFLIIWMWILQACVSTIASSTSAEVAFYGSDGELLRMHEFAGKFRISIPMLEERETVTLYLLTKDHKDLREVTWEKVGNTQEAFLEIKTSGLYQFALEYQQDEQFNKIVHSMAFQVLQVEDYVTWKIYHKDEFSCQMDLEIKQQENLMLQFCQVDTSNCKPISIDWKETKGTVVFDEPGAWQLELRWFFENGEQRVKRYDDIYEMKAKPPVIKIMVNGNDIIDRSIPMQNHNVDVDLEVSGKTDKFEVFLNDMEKDLKWENGTTSKTKLSLLEDGEYTIQVCAIQDEKKTCKTTLPVIIDQTPPYVAIANVRPFYQESMKLSMIIRDAHLHENGISMEVLKDGMEFKDFDKDIQQTTYGKKVDLTFTQEGTYEINFFIKDQAGNPTTVIHNELFLPIQNPIPFTIDQTKPEVTFLSPSDCEFSNQPIQIQAIAADAHLDTFQIALYHNDVLIQQQLLKEKKRAAFSWNCDNDGTYRFIATAKDTSGWMVKKETTFTIDQTPPHLIVTFNDLIIRNDQRYITNQNVDVLIRWLDDTDSTASIQMKKNKEVMLQKQTSEVFHIPIHIQQGKETEYEFQVEVRDQAGNRIKHQYRLIMDAFLPVLRFENEPFQGKPRNVRWQPKLEHEGSAFHVIDVDLYRNQRLMRSYRWPEIIDQEGSYQLSFIVRDDAMNEAAYLPPFSFIIDQTPPTARIVEDERREELISDRVSLDTILRLYLEDQYCDPIHIHTLTLNDQNMDTQKMMRDEFDKAYYLIRFDQVQDHSLTMDVSDDAGNHLKKTMIFHVEEDLKQEDVLTIPNPIRITPTKHTSLRYGAMFIGGFASLFLFCMLWRKYAT